MKTIWKYPIEISDEFEIVVPEGADFLHVGLDPNDQPCVWLLVDPAKEKSLVAIHLRIYGTGHKIETSTRHLGSFVQGQFVWHVFSWH